MVHCIYTACINFRSSMGKGLSDDGSFPLPSSSEGLFSLVSLPILVVLPDSRLNLLCLFNRSFVAGGGFAAIVGPISLGSLLFNETL